jgi:hypothetical protein
MCPSEQPSFDWVFQHFRHALNGSTPTENKWGDIVPLNGFTDGCGKIGSSFAKILVGTNHRLCVFHLSLNVNDCIKPIFRVNRGYAKEWYDFQNLFWKTAHQSDVVKTDAMLAEMLTLLQFSQAQSTHMMHAKIPGKGLGLS